MPNHLSKKFQISSNDTPSFFDIRRCIMLHLYDFFKKFPLATIGLDQIADDCQIAVSDLNWNIVYLEKSGWVELSKSYDEPPYVAASVTLTAKGIDIIENDAEFDTKFPIEPSNDEHP